MIFVDKIKERLFTLSAYPINRLSICGRPKINDVNKLYFEHPNIFFNSMLRSIASMENIHLTNDS